ncbi:nitrite/sulfite reductase [Lentisphaerota bacterium ZTH]|nr:nitrite/sulfite reductase [Lentisphaerota bacterium]WET05168.1 nitrite/sulfite reductase [Lentisphaerota bacterium ZTH]
MKPEYIMLEEHLNAFINGEIKAQELKHTSAQLGIYQQRNDKFMTRIRVPGGHISVGQFRDAARAIKQHNAGFIHLSTRQDMQVQDVPAEEVLPLIRALTDHGMPFIGGGGNTFRNIMAPPDSGIVSDDVFDVIAYARRLTRAMFSWEKAFKLPRKLKIGFFASSRDEHLAAIQDLGFIAMNKDGKPGFKVYGGGGMGRESAFGVLLFDWIPVEETARCARAMTEMFYDHGNRENRMQARVRFILKRLGETEFKKLFMEYYSKAESGQSMPEWDYDLSGSLSRLKKFDTPESAAREFQAWQELVVTPAKFNHETVSVLLRVPNGNLTSSQMELIADLSEKCGLEFLRLTTEQNLLLPIVHKSALPEIFNFLNDISDNIDLCLKSFSGNIVSCVGANICKIGILDSTAMAQKIADKLDELLITSPELKTKLANRIVEMIRISGCLNSCSGHPAACIGMQGLKKKGEPHYTMFLREGDNKFELSAPQEEPLPLDAAAEKVIDILKQKFNLV